MAFGEVVGDSNGRKVAAGTTLRLDTADFALEFGWQVESARQTDEFNRGGITIAVEYSPDDDISSISRRGGNREHQTFGQDSAGKHERLKIWLGGRAPAAVKDVTQPGKTRIDSSQKPGDWTREEFIDAVEDSTDRAFLLRLLELVDTNSQLASKGDHVQLYFGRRPGGAMFIYPCGRRFPPFKFFVKAGQLMISGCWTGFPGVKAHPGFADLASMLDLDESGTATAVPAFGLDADEVWEVGETVSRAINT